MQFVRQERRKHKIIGHILKIQPEGQRGFFSPRAFLRFYVFLNKMGRNGPMYMKFGTNVVFTIENNKKKKMISHILKIQPEGQRGFFGRKAFFTILCFPDRLVMNDPMYMKFVINVDFTMTKRLNKTISTYLVNLARRKFPKF